MSVAINDLVTNNFGSATIDRDASPCTQIGRLEMYFIKKLCTLRRVRLAATSTSSSSTSTGMEAKAAAEAAEGAAAASEEDGSDSGNDSDSDSKVEDHTDFFTA